MIGCVLLEAGTRIFFFGTLNPAFALQPFTAKGIVQQSPIKGLPYVLRSLTTTVHKGAQVTINSASMRDEEYAQAKPADTIRIAIVGDSYSFGSGVDSDKVYHSILEEQFNDAGNLHYEFLNFAVPGFGLREYNSVLRSQVQHYNPDVIVVGLCLRNDFRDNQKKIAKPRSFSFWQSYTALLLKKKQAHTRRIQKDDALTENTRRYVDEQLGALAAYAAQQSIPLLVAGLEYHPHFKSNDVFFQEAVEAHGLPYVSLIDRFDSTDSSEYYIYHWDGHPNAKANAIFAQAIAPEVVELLEW